MQNLFMDLGQGAQGRVRPIDFSSDCILVSLINSDYLYEESKSNVKLFFPFFSICYVLSLTGFTFWIEENESRISVFCEGGRKTIHIIEKKHVL